MQAVGPTTYFVKILQVCRSYFWCTQLQTVGWSRKKVVDLQANNLLIEAVDCKLKGGEYDNLKFIYQILSLANTFALRKFVCWFSLNLPLNVYKHNHFKMLQIQDYFVCRLQMSTFSCRCKLFPLLVVGLQAGAW